MTGGEIVALAGIAAGIAGTLLGTGLGGWLTWKVLERQLEHADKTRFHERRLDIYATYTGAVSAPGRSTHPALLWEGPIEIPTPIALSDLVRTSRLHAQEHLLLLPRPPHRLAQ